jgi:hypothetical protein
MGRVPTGGVSNREDGAADPPPVSGHSAVVGAVVARSKPTHLGYGTTRTLGSKTGLHAVNGESTRPTLDILPAFIEVD